MCRRTLTTITLLLVDFYGQFKNVFHQNTHVHPLELNKFYLFQGKYFNVNLNCSFSTPLSTPFFFKQFTKTLLRARLNNEISLQTFHLLVSSQCPSITHPKVPCLPAHMHNATWRRVTRNGGWGPEENLKLPSGPIGADCGKRNRRATTLLHNDLQYSCHCLSTGCPSGWH